MVGSFCNPNGHYRKTALISLCHPASACLKLPKMTGLLGTRRTRCKTATCNELNDELNLVLAVIEAENGRVALDILDSPQGDSIDIILTDNLMPEVVEHPA